MKYWKGINTKAGQYGTVDDNGKVPDSIPCTQGEYQTWVNSLPVDTKLTLKELMKTKGLISQAEYDNVR